MLEKLGSALVGTLFCCASLGHLGIYEKTHEVPEALTEDRHLLEARDYTISSTSLTGAGPHTAASGQGCLVLFPGVNQDIPGSHARDDVVNKQKDHALARSFWVSIILRRGGGAGPGARPRWSRGDVPSCRTLMWGIAVAAHARRSGAGSLDATTFDDVRSLGGATASTPYTMKRSLIGGFDGRGSTHTDPPMGHPNTPPWPSFGGNRAAQSFL